MKQRTLLHDLHLAVICDGNGRWAERRGLPRWEGHRVGARAAHALITHCATRGVGQLSLYAFSSDNWSRPRAEVSALLALCAERLAAETRALADAGIRTLAIGRRDRLPVPLLRAITDVEAATRGGRRMTLRIALDYSSRAAIASSITRPPAREDANTIVPAVDLLLRTGGEHRLSDFLLWECAYAELAFLDVPFPDLRPEHVDAVVDEFRQRERRFGGLPLQRGA
jgi:undecaprenyl diphosphate synthase